MLYGYSVIRILFFLLPSVLAVFAIVVFSHFAAKKELSKRKKGYRGDVFENKIPAEFTKRERLYSFCVGLCLLFYFGLVLVLLFKFGNSALELVQILTPLGAFLWFVLIKLGNKRLFLGFVLAFSVMAATSFIAYRIYYLDSCDAGSTEINCQKCPQLCVVPFGSMDRMPSPYPPETPTVLYDCGDNYDCFLEQAQAGRKAKILITGNIETLSLRETSKVEVEPYGGNFRKVSMTVLKLEKIRNGSSVTRPILESISETCPQALGDPSLIVGKSAFCVVASAQKAKKLALEGLSDEVIKKYSCEGSLIDEIRRICVWLMGTSQPLTTQQSSGWRTVAVSATPGLVIEYPSFLKVTSNDSVPIVQVTFEGSGGDLVHIFVSAANINLSNQNLKDWLQSHDYFKHQYRSQTYKSHKRKDGVEVLASFGNAQSYDDAFIRIGTTILYVKNGVNENTKAKESDFREMIERIKLPNNFSIGVVGNSEFSCLVGSDELMTLYWGTQYRKSNPTVPFIYAPGSYCEALDGSKLMTMAYLDKSEGGMQAIVLFDKEGKIVRTYKGKICETAGDLGSPHILSVERGTLNLFCLSGDMGGTLFTAYQAPTGTLVPTEVQRGTSLFNTIEEAIEKLYNLDFSSSEF